MKIAITGALGHIGSRLIRTLPATFAEVELVLVDNLSTQRYGSLFDLPPDINCRFIEADVREFALAPLISGAQVVVHLAAMTNAVASVDRAAEVESHNLAATRRVAEACAETGTPLIFPSSTSVYGPQGATVDERCGVAELNPQSPYAATKLREESSISELGSTAGLQYMVLRLGTIFGPSPGMRFHTAVNKFCWQAAFGQPLTVWRTALDQQRPYLDLEDAVRAIAFIIERRSYDCGTYNVVSLNATVGQVVAEIRQHVPSLQLDLVDHSLMNQLSYSVSNSRFRQLGFEFRGDLVAGIRATMALLLPGGSTPKRFTQ